MTNEFKTEFLTGSAGTGKTYTIKNRIKEANENGERKYGTLCATTGIAAINLQSTDDPTNSDDSITTINSILQFFDTESLEDNYLKGKLENRLKWVASRGRNIIIDEVSMMEARQLDILMKGVEKVNETREVRSRGGLGVILTGDFCQLPPVQGKFAFEATCWNRYFGEGGNITRLEKVWRQSEPLFLQSLNYSRQGDGEKAVECLIQLDGVKFTEVIGSEFDGTTIFSKNILVDRFNNIRLMGLLDSGKEQLNFKNYRWGKQRGEWKIIPNDLMVSVDSYVMILVNKTSNGMMEYANGDCGYCVEGLGEHGINIRLKRNGEEVEVKRILRKVYDGKFGPPPIDYLDSKSKYEDYLNDTHSPLGGMSSKELKRQYEIYLDNLTIEIKPKEFGKPYFDFKEGKWVVGEINYLPIRLAYATTVHKTQGLTLDNVQIDISDKFFGEPSMAYVSLSRVRSPEGLRIVGSPGLLEKRINILEDVLRWI